MAIAQRPALSMVPGPPQRLDPTERGLLLLAFLEARVRLDQRWLSKADSITKG